MTSIATTKVRQRKMWFTYFSVSAFLLAIVGCGDTLAPVSGKVTYKGQLVKGGTLTFSPAGEKNPGKSASAKIQDDGTYKAGTHTEGDGAIVGKHKITFLAAEPEVTDQQRMDPKFNAKPSPYGGLVPKNAEIEVKSGANTIDIELDIDRTPKKGPVN